MKGSAHPTLAEDEGRLSGAWSGIRGGGDGLGGLPGISGVNPGKWLKKIQLPMQETEVQSLGWEDPLEKEMATCPSIIAWEIPRTEKPGRLQSLGLQSRT